MEGSVTKHQQVNDFVRYLEVSQDDETTAEIEEISNDARYESKTFHRMSCTDDHLFAKQQRQQQSIPNSLDTLEASSFDKERAEMTENFENEKSDIVKGFILEKKILSRDHEKEKEDLVANFVHERKKMLDSFQHQVKEIEQKMSKTSDTESVFNITSDTKPTKIRRSPSSGKLLIRVDGDRILTPEEFLSAMELEEKFESEKELIEKSYRKEKSKLREKLEIEYERKFLRAKQEHDTEMCDLHQEIDKLKNLKHEVADMWKHQACKLETEFFRERSTLEKQFADQKETLRKKLEERNSLQLQEQQEDYDRTIRELKNELRKIKSQVSKHENLKDDRNTIHIRKEIETKYQSDFDNETRIIRHQNEKLNAELQALTTEKYELNRKLRDMELNKDDESKLSKEINEKMNKEYSEKIRKLTTLNEKLKSQGVQKEQELQTLKTQLRNQQDTGKNIEGRLQLTECTIVQYEDTVTSMRRENSNLSHEISLLRKEKDELKAIIGNYNEKDRKSKAEQLQTCGELQETTKKYAMLEREKLLQTRTINNLRKELGTATCNMEAISVKITAHEKETERLRNLVDGERKENKRLHERFKNDAELLRTKDNENGMIRTQLDNIKTQFQTLKAKIEIDNDNILKMETENNTLKTQVQKLKTTDSISKKHDLLQIQNKYVKEFSKRLEYVKANYEREIFKLKETIEELQQHHSSNNNNSPTILTTPQQPTANWSPCCCRKCCGNNNQDEYRRTEKVSKITEMNNLLTTISDQKHSNFHATIEVLDNPQKRHEKQAVPKQFNKTNQNTQTIDQLTVKTQDQIEDHQHHQQEYAHGHGYDGIEELFSRVKRAELSANNDELRNLLKDVRQEVVTLNKLIDEQTPQSTPQLTPRLILPKNDTIRGNDDTFLASHMKAAKERELRLQDKLANKESEVNESKEAMKRLCDENNELQRRLDEQEKELEEHETSCDELYKRRLMMEKLVDRLQFKLREEASKRRRLEQANNAIEEDSREDFDDSTV